MNDTTNTDKGFKLLAIRPLKGCDTKYSKNLELGRIYQFYNDYKFDITVDSSGKETMSIIHQPTVPDNLYDVITVNGNPLKINISAIVGKNGSGKSTLLELFYGMVYLLAEKDGILIEDGIVALDTLLKEYKEIQEQFFPQQSEHRDSLEESNDSQTTQTIGEIKEILKNEKNETFQYLLQVIKNKLIPDPVHIDPKEKIVYTERRKSALETFLNELKAEVFFQLEGNYYKLTTNSDKSYIGLYNISKNEWEGRKIVNNFFYSLAVNYSIHGLNARHIGEWINPLFHKNDAYQTPLVINPMRNDGDIDINNEEYLAKSRLLANALKKTNNKYNLLLTEKQEVNRLFFKLNESKVFIVYEKDTGSSAKPRLPVTFEEFYQNHVELGKGISNDDAEKLLFKKIYEVLFDETIEMEDIPDIYKDSQHSEFVKKYILQKLVKIARKKGYGYEAFFKGQTNLLKQGKNTYRLVDVFSLNEDNGEQSIFEKYLRTLKKDKSHITLKLRQAINYLKNKPLNNLKTVKKKDDLSLRQWHQAVDKYDPSKFFEQYNVSAISLADQLNEYLKNEDDQIIDFLPPPLFDVDIEMRNIDDSNISLFTQLSSGEQQHIHSIHSILYHLNNLDSVFKQPSEQEGGRHRQTYPQINIMLDEIELYFHPDFQRKFIADLRSGIERLSMGGKDENGKSIGIQSINILLSTHSPFILSDIPSQNVLRLKDGQPYEEPQKGTFGANIHDLLHNDFFLENGFMGEFAEKKIKRLITQLNFLSYKKEYNDPETDDWRKLQLELELHQLIKILYNDESLRDKNLAILLMEIDFDKKELAEIISLIGEPILYHKLTVMFEEVFENNQEKFEVKQELLKIANAKGIRIQFNDEKQ